MLNTRVKRSLSVRMRKFRAEALFETAAAFLESNKTEDMWNLWQFGDIDSITRIRIARRYIYKLKFTKNDNSSMQLLHAFLSTIPTNEYIVLHGQTDVYFDALRTIRPDWLLHNLTLSRSNTILAKYINDAFLASSIPTHIGFIRARPKAFQRYYSRLPKLDTCPVTSSVPQNADITNAEIIQYVKLYNTIPSILMQTLNQRQISLHEILV
jgi:hypothetical protein